jgi:hypothetical protein
MSCAVNLSPAPRFINLSLVPSNLLEESVSIAGNIPEARDYETRAQFRLSRLYRALGNSEKSHQCKVEAKKARIDISHDSPDSNFTDKNYDDLVLWMLW